MANVIHTALPPATEDGGHRPKRQETWEFRLTLAATFLILLVGITATRIVRLLARQPHVSSKRHSVFREAWQKANACIGLAYCSG